MAAMEKIFFRAPEELIERFRVAAELDRRTPSMAARVAMEDYAEKIEDEYNKKAR
jgi:predicted DNA-binding protein